MHDNAQPITPTRALPHLGSYTRNLPVSLARMYENALDWEHLPHLHSDSFKEIHCREAGDWGWHCDAVLANDAPVELELRLDREAQRWITRTISGLGAGSEIWSYVFERPEGGLRVVVDFFVPDVPDEARGQMLAYYKSLYAGLYDEDVSMMTGRQMALQSRPDKLEIRSLGARSDVLARVPFLFDLAGKTFRLVEADGALVAHAALCPHMLGPLSEAALVDGAITCPWHGYVFDIKTGLERTGQSCQLAKAPHISVSADGDVVANMA